MAAPHPPPASSSGVVALSAAAAAAAGKGQRQQNGLSVMSAVLDQNDDLLAAIAECQKLGKACRAARYQRQLHDNIILLAQLCDGQDYYTTPFSELALRSLPPQPPRPSRHSPIMVESTTDKTGEQTTTMTSNRLPPNQPPAAATSSSTPTTTTSSVQSSSAQPPPPASAAPPMPRPQLPNKQQQQQQRRPEEVRDGRIGGERREEDRRGAAAAPTKVSSPSRAPSVGKTQQPVVASPPTAASPSLAPPPPLPAPTAPSAARPASAPSPSSLPTNRTAAAPAGSLMQRPFHQAQVRPPGGRGVVQPSGIGPAPAAAGRMGAPLSMPTPPPFMMPPMIFPGANPLMFQQMMMMQAAQQQAMLQQQKQQQQQQQMRLNVGGAAAANPAAGQPRHALVQTPMGLMRVQLVGPASGGEDLKLPVLGQMSLSSMATGALPTAGFPGQPPIVPGVAPRAEAAPQKEVVAWTDDEEQKLKEALTLYKQSDHARIAQHIVTKTKNQVRARLKKEYRARKKEARRQEYLQQQEKRGEGQQQKGQEEKGVSGAFSPQVARGGETTAGTGSSIATPVAAVTCIPAPSLAAS